MIIPEWFKRDLEIIDPSYFVVYNELYSYFEIKRKMTMDKKIEIEGGVTSDGRGFRIVTESQAIRVSIKNPTVAVFKILNDAALTNLRKRKYIGIKFQRTYNPLAYLNWIISENEEAKKKKRQLAAEMITAGFLKMYKLERSKTFDMGGVA